MEKRGPEQKQDRRTRYTKGVIKESFMKLLQQKPFAKITVTEICRLSDINRGTFYLHYYDVYDVLDDLIYDLFHHTSGIIDHVLCPQRSACAYPLCEKIQGSSQYHALIMDDVASARFLEKLSDFAKEGFVTFLMQNSRLTFEEAEAVFCFQINGCLTINKLMIKNHCTDWHKVQNVIDEYIRAGLKTHINAQNCQPLRR
mgnify:CR=1 FL=1